jgi:hypothetical protein
MRVPAVVGIAGAAALAVAAVVAVLATRDEADSDDASTSVPASTRLVLGCRVTIPNGMTAAGVRPGSDEHGSSSLTTLLGSNGIFLVAPKSSPEYRHPDGGLAVDGVLKQDGSVSIKQGWRRGDGIRGRIRVQARRLDAPAPRVDRTLPPGGYGLTGFQATYLELPTVGCWRVTGSVGTAKVTFVTLVKRAPRRRNAAANRARSPASTAGTRSGAGTG